MIKEYKATDAVQLSPHFNSREFRCHCGKCSDYKIDTDLIDRLEKLFEAVNASYIVITSGYRCSAHDKAVGGSGSGQHTKGTAADCIVYGQDRTPISTKIISCKAQDIGFTGIANINAAYTAIHLDTRQGVGKWYGDETKGLHTVTYDFYKYYGITKNPQSFILQQGSSGENVRTLQTRLYNAGYLPAGQIDGVFGRITLGAVLAWQYLHNATMSGMIDNSTLDRI